MYSITCNPGLVATHQGGKAVLTKIISDSLKIDLSLSLISLEAAGHDAR